MTMTTGLIRFTQRARAEPRTRFNALMGLLFDPEGLHASFARQKGKKAPGVDGIRKVDYAQAAYLSQSLSHTAVEDSSWEPNGVTHPVRFYEGGGAYLLRGSPPLLSKSACPVR